MANMDLKGITWVGHVYQKFEAMCLEVEEVMYQDTVKYVENQVQTVGASVKKFYSDVMQDILPPSSMDLVKGAAASNLPAEQFIGVEIYKEPKVGMKEEALNVDNEQSSDGLEATAKVDKDAGNEPSFYGFHVEDTSFQPSSENTVKGAWPDLYSKQYDNRMCKKSRLGAKKISKKENFSPSEMSGAITHLENSRSRASSFYELSDKNQEASFDQVTTSRTPVTVEITGCNSIEEVCDEIENASNPTPGILIDSQSSEVHNEIENGSAHSSCNGVSAELNAVDISTNNGVVSLVVSPANGDLQSSEFPDKIVFVCHPARSDDSTADTIESKIGSETIPQVDNIQVEGSCVLVNGDDLHFVPQKDRKHRPYKKKIRDAISSRMKSVRKREYKQIAVWYGENVQSNHEPAENLMSTIVSEGMKRSPSHNLSESEWELL